VVQSPDHHAAFFAAASVAYVGAVVASTAHVASVAAVTGVVVAASVGTSLALVVASSEGFPFEKQDVVVESAFAAVAVASVVVVASVAVVVPFAAASFLVVAAVVVASLGCPAGAALAVLVLGIEAGSECRLEAGSLA